MNLPEKLNLPFLSLNFLIFDAKIKLSQLNEEA